MKSAWVLGLGLLACGPVKGTPSDALAPIDECDPLAFVRCNGAIAETCNADGNGVTQEDCGMPGCNATAGRCNVCAPDVSLCGPGGQQLQNCGPDGLPAAPTACQAGCTDTPEPHCSYLKPNYAALGDVCDAPATMAALDITSNQTLDTASDAVVCTGGVLTQTGGPPICVLRFDTISVAANRTLAFTGPRLVALVADTRITVDGVIEASAVGTTSGPGGGLTTSGSRANAQIGGGGAGFRTNGGDGGDDTSNGGGANGGAASTNPADLVAMVGGPRPQIPLAGDPLPGGGGGGITLIACRGEVTISATGTIAANGGGGQAGFDKVAGTNTSFISGAGGGAGGNIVLQGLAVTMLGRAYANGGGGGGGTGGDDVAGVAGQDGQRSTSQATGGSGASNGGGGGQGGAGLLVPGAGFRSIVTVATPGGGGGSVGFLQIYVPTGVTPTLTPVETSPSFQATRVAQTR